MTSGTSMSFASVFTSRVLPLPVGPMMMMLLLSSSQSSTSGPISWFGFAMDLLEDEPLSSSSSMLGVSQNGAEAGEEDAGVAASSSSTAAGAAADRPNWFSRRSERFGSRNDADPSSYTPPPPPPPPPPFATSSGSTPR